MKTTARKRILDDLDRLSPQMQEKAAQLVHGLVSPVPRGIPGRELLRFAGSIDPESLRQIEEAIEESCERVDLDEW